MLLSLEIIDLRQLYSTEILDFFFFNAKIKSIFKPASSYILYAGMSALG